MSLDTNSKHEGIRDLLRVVGPCVMLVGVIFLIIGLSSFFSAFNSTPNFSRSFNNSPQVHFQPHKSPDNFWCLFVAMPFLAVGAMICRFAFIGAVSRYVADEVAPVGKDVVNYMAQGTQDTIGEVAAVIGQRLKAAGPSHVHIVRCHKCNADNGSDAKFCKDCGSSISKSKHCNNCNELNDPDAKFCDNCGKQI